MQMSEFTFPEEKRGSTSQFLPGAFLALIAVIGVPPTWLLASWLLDGLPGHPLWQRADQVLLTLELGSWQLPFGLFSLAHLLVGMGLIGLGSIRIAQAGAALRRSGSHSPSLVRHGPFARLRHPKSSGLMLAGLGFCFALRSPWTLGLALLWMATLMHFALKEEREQRAASGEDYRRYAHHVPERIFGGAGWALVVALMVWSSVGFFA